MEIKLKQFTVPNFVVQKTDREIRGEGPSYPLSEVPAEDLARLCDNFRRDVFAKAGKDDPEASTKSKLLSALRYARRFLNKKDHDVAFVDAAIAKAEGKEQG